MSYHYGPSAVGNLLNPKPKSYTRDHMAENRARIAAIQETAQIRAEYEEGLEATKGARFTLSRFAHVAPRVAVPHGEAHMENTDPRPSRKAGECVLTRGFEGAARRGVRLPPLGLLPCF